MTSDTSVSVETPPTRRSSRISNSTANAESLQFKPQPKSEAKPSIKAEVKTQIKQTKETKSLVRPSLAEGFPKSTIPESIFKRKKSADGGEVNELLTLRREVARLTAENDTLTGQKVNNALLIQDLRDTIASHVEIEATDAETITLLNEDLLQGTKTARRLQTLLNDTQAELQFLRTDLRPRGLVSSHDRLVMAHTRSQAGSDDEDDGGNDIWATTAAIRPDIFGAPKPDPPGSKLRTYWWCNIVLYHLPLGWLLRSRTFNFFQPCHKPLLNIPPNDHSNQIHLPSLQNAVALQRSEDPFQADGANAAAGSASANTQFVLHVKTKPVETRKTRIIRELQGDNLRLQDRIQQLEGQIWDLGEYSSHQTRHVESLKNLNNATAGMVVKLRDEIWELRQGLKESGLSRSMARMHDVYVHPDLKAIGKLLLAAVEALQNELREDYDPEMYRNRGSSTSPLNVLQAEAEDLLMEKATDAHWTLQLNRRSEQRKEDVGRQFRQMQRDNRALRHENLVMEGQCHELTSQVESLKNIGIASTDMVMKLRKEITVLRRQLDNNVVADSMKRLGDLVPYPENAEITNQLSTAIRKLEEDDAMLVGDEASESGCSSSSTCSL
ncbi:hypothetical protein C8J56DRAFT_881151 [Mycena floridula]|nr:hypothetical protein C8J56DRAFT_881151 [Mycena floridula]